MSTTDFIFDEDLRKAWRITQRTIERWVEERAFPCRRRIGRKNVRLLAEVVKWADASDVPVPSDWRRQ